MFSNLLLIGFPRLKIYLPHPEAGLRERGTFRRPRARLDEFNSFEAIKKLLMPFAAPYGTGGFDTFHVTLTTARWAVTSLTERRVTSPEWWLKVV
jgi:hypothetical protein